MMGLPCWHIQRIEPTKRVTKKILPLHVAKTSSYFRLKLGKQKAVKRCASARDIWPPRCWQSSGWPKIDIASLMIVDRDEKRRTITMEPCDDCPMRSRNESMAMLVAIERVNRHVPRLRRKAAGTENCDGPTLVQSRGLDVKSRPIKPNRR